MPLVKVIRHGQVTLPTKFREALNINEGDYLEAECYDDQIVLRPAVVLKRDEAIKRLHRLMDEIQARNEDIPIEELEQDVREAVQAVRHQKHYAKSRT